MEEGGKEEGGKEDGGTEDEGTEDEGGENGGMGGKTVFLEVLLVLNFLHDFKT